MKILVTGGAGFIGSHIAEHYAERDEEVTVYDNLSRGEFIKSAVEAGDFNWNYLSKYSNVKRIQGDVRDYEALERAMKGCEVVFHTAAQTAVNASIADPVDDFTVNSLGAFNVLETARRVNPTPVIIHCSTSRVYGINVNRLNIIEEEKSLKFAEPYANGIPEDFSIDGIGRTPYGCSKLTGDIYMQEYAHLFGLKIGVFRMSTIYGERGFGIEDQGWMAKIASDTLMEKTVNIHGDGKQTRDPLYIADLLKAFDAFLQSDLRGGLFNVGGGIKNALSILEFLDLLKKITGKRSETSLNEPEPYHQKVFISDISKAKRLLNWEPTVNITGGAGKMVDWIKANL